MAKAIAVFVVGFIAGALSLTWVAEPWLPKFDAKPADGKVSERVELVHTRTRLWHKECSGAGFWECCGKPQKIEGGGVFGADVHLWPHKCSGCGQTNTLFNVRYPQIKSEWRAVR